LSGGFDDASPPRAEFAAQQIFGRERYVHAALGSQCVEVEVNRLGRHLAPDKKFSRNAHRRCCPHTVPTAGHLSGAMVVAVRVSTPTTSDTAYPEVTSPSQRHAPDWQQ
jgi:hypothetical protein